MFRHPSIVPAQVLPTHYTVPSQQPHPMQTAASPPHSSLPSHAQALHHPSIAFPTRCSVPSQQPRPMHTAARLPHASLPRPSPTHCSHLAAAPSHARCCQSLPMPTPSIHQLLPPLPSPRTTPSLRSSPVPCTPLPVYHTHLFPCPGPSPLALSQQPLAMHDCQPTTRIPSHAPVPPPTLRRLHGTAAATLLPMYRLSLLYIAHYYRPLAVALSHARYSVSHTFSFPR